MLKNILLSAVLLFSLATFAQKSSMKFGKIDEKDLMMKNFEADTSAGALVLGDIGSITISYKTMLGFEVDYTRHVRVKIFNANGFDMANFKIPYYEVGTTRERITKIKVTAYNLENGKVVQTSLKKTDMYVEDLSSKEKSLNFSVPNVKKGSVFEVEYNLTSELFWHMRDWDFQYTVPARYSELSVVLPEYFIYKKLMSGYLSPSVNKTESYTQNIALRNDDNSMENIPYRGTIQKLRFDDVPAFKHEPYMNALSNYLSSIEFELGAIDFPYSKKDFSTSWEKISKDLWQDQDFGTQLKRNCPIKELAAILMIVPDEKERMIMAHGLVRDNMAFNNKDGIYVTTTLRKAWNEKIGKAADINLLLISLLNEIGIETEPILLSTRNNGILHPAQIMLSKFNYVIAEARIGDKTFLLDATDKYLPYSVLPERCLNGQGRRISLIEQRNDWVSLDQNNLNERVFFAQTKLAPDGNIAGEFNLKESAYYAYKRSELIRKEAEQDDYIAAYEAETPGLVIDEFTIENQDDLQNTLIIMYKGKLNMSDETHKDMLYINPLLGNGISVNPFTLEARDFPVDFITPFSLKAINMLEIPDGYEVAEIPKSTLLSLPDELGTYRYAIAVKGNQVHVNSTFLMKTAQVLPTHYANLREFYSMIVAKNAEMLVLKKM